MMTKRVLLLALLAIVGMGSAHASVITIGDGASADENGVAIGDDADAGRGIAIGLNAKNNHPDPMASGLDQIAIGTNASTNGYQSVAIGFGSSTNGNNGVAINGTSNGDSTTAINGVGWGAKSVVVGGYGAGHGNVVMGHGAVTGQAGPSGPGYVEFATVVGTGAKVEDRNSAAFGAFSTSDGRENVFSVGNSQPVAVDVVNGLPAVDPTFRQIINVGAGTEDHDAVIVQQIKPFASSLGGGSNFDGGVFTGPTYNLSTGTYNTVEEALLAIDGKAAGPGGSNPYFAAQGHGVAGDDAVASDMDTTAAGAHAQATNYGSTAYGSLSNVTGEAGTGVGHQATVTADEGTALGAYTNASAHCSAIGYGAECDEYGTTSFGTDSDPSRLINVAPGMAHSDAATVGQMVPMAQALGGGSSYINGVFMPPNYAFISGNTYNNVGDAMADLDSRVYDLEQQPPGSGPAGADGASAYEVAVSNGFSGSETEWLASLKGDKGDPGDVGPQGPAGQDGEDGVDGQDGDTGPQGPEGPAGQDGQDGADGQDGVDGQDGQDGDTGPRGPEGPQGPAGEDGVDGQDGSGNGATAIAGRNIEVTDNDDGTQTVSVTNNVKLSDQGSVEVGATRVDANGVAIQGGPSMTTNGIDAGNRRVTSVANGRIEQGSLDAVNGGQIWALEQGWNDRWTEIHHRVDGLEDQIDAVGAQSAAMAQMSAAGTYLPVGKVAINAGYGQYGNSKAFAVGAKVRFSERTSGSLGFSASDDGKLMIGAGFSVVLP